MRRRFAPLIFIATLAFGVSGLLAQRADPTPIRPPGTSQAADRKFNFTPRVGELISDGFPSTVVFFLDGTLTMQLNLPTGWKVAGTPAEMYFENPTYVGARITLRVSSLAAPPTFDEAWIATTKPLLMASLPRDSNNGKIANVALDAYNVAGWKSVEFKEQFDVAGRRMAQSWMFLKLVDGRFLEVVFSSREEAFPTVRAAVIRILAGWGQIVTPPAKK